MFKKIAEFFREVKLEMTKVSWPTKDETIGSTVVVIVVVAIVSLFIGVIDVLISAGLEWIVTLK